MKLNVYVAFNAFLNCSGQPRFDDHEPDVFAKQFERFLLTSEEEKVFQFENVSWYCIGSYDDESMKFDTLKEPLLLLTCNKVLEERKVRAKLIEKARELKEGESDGNVKD